MKFSFSSAENPDLNNFDQWALIYDKVYQNLVHDIPFYLQQAKAHGGPILELGCGTGRVTIPLASNGFEVVGIDISPSMIQRANANAKQKGSIPGLSFHAADMRDFKFERQFSMVIIPFRGLMLLNNKSEQQSTFFAAARHLNSGGKLIFDLFNPSNELLNDTDPEPFIYSNFQLVEGGSIKVHASNDWDRQNQLSMPNIWIEEYDASGSLIKSYFHKLKMRYLYVDETISMLSEAGFEIDAIYGSFDGQIYDNSSDDQVWVCTIPYKDGN